MQTKNTNRRLAGLFVTALLRTKPVIRKKAALSNSWTQKGPAVVTPARNINARANSQLALNSNNQLQDHRRLSAEFGEK